PLPRVDARPHAIDAFACDVPRLPNADLAPAPRLPDERAQEPVERQERLADATFGIEERHRTFGDDLLDAPPGLAFVFELIDGGDDHRFAAAWRSRTSRVRSSTCSSSRSIRCHNSSKLGL